MLFSDEKLSFLIDRLVISKKVIAWSLSRVWNRQKFDVFVLRIFANKFKIRKIGSPAGLLSHINLLQTLTSWKQLTRPEQTGVISSIWALEKKTLMKVLSVQSKMPILRGFFVLPPMDEERNPVSFPAFYSLCVAVSAIGRKGTSSSSSYHTEINTHLKAIIKTHKICFKRGIC